MNQIALILFNAPTLPNWELGPVWQAPNQPAALAQFMAERLAEIHPEAWLFWDKSLGMPDAQKIQAILNQPDDLWHAGLQLGLRGLPGVIDFIAPNWMLNSDPQVAAASWRVSLQACLVRDEVLRQMGFIQPDFETLEVAALEWGHRCIQRGVFCRWEPDLLPVNFETRLPIQLPANDELRFAEYRFGRRWRTWAAMRATLSGYWGIAQTWKATRSLWSNPINAAKQITYQHAVKEHSSKPIEARVSVLIPTLERYPYLKTVLAQLREQRVPPLEIIVIDQTPIRQRQPEIYEEFKDLPLHVIFQENAGQCSSRNAGLQASRGEYILFIDDDDEVETGLIEQHIQHIEHTRSEASCGVANETGIRTLPEAFTYQRISDVFPTNNSLLQRKALIRSGLFDLAYEHGARADGDLGMRLYLNGARLILNPEIAVLHHHAPRGGLRKHKARVITYASSRQSLTQRNLPSATEIYLSRRYFTARQTREMIWMSVFASFSLHHPSRWRRFLKVIIGLFLLPNTLLRLNENKKNAEQLAKQNPNIPELPQNLKE